MEDLLSKEHCCYKIHTLSMKSSVYPSPPSIDNPVLWATSNFYKKILISPFFGFSKIPTPYKERKGEGLTLWV